MFAAHTKIRGPLDFLFLVVLNMQTYAPKRKRPAPLITPDYSRLERCKETVIDGYLVRITNSQATIVRLSDHMPLLYAPIRTLAQIGVTGDANIVQHMYMAGLVRDRLDGVR